MALSHVRPVFKQMLHAWPAEFKDKLTEVQVAALQANSNLQPCTLLASELCTYAFDWPAGTSQRQTLLSSRSVLRRMYSCQALANGNT